MSVAWGDRASSFGGSDRPGQVARCDRILAAQPGAAALDGRRITLAAFGISEADAFLGVERGSPRGYGNQAAALKALVDENRHRLWLG